LAVKPDDVVTRKKPVASEEVKVIAPVVAGAEVDVPVNWGKIDFTEAFNVLMATTPCCSVCKISPSPYPIISAP
jgi:hypothetical protein